VRDASATQHDDDAAPSLQHGSDDEGGCLPQICNVATGLPSCGEQLAPGSQKAKVRGGTPATKDEHDGVASLGLPLRVSGKGTTPMTPGTSLMMTPGISSMTGSSTEQYLKANAPTIKFQAPVVSKDEDSDDYDDLAVVFTPSLSSCKSVTDGVLGKAEQRQNEAVGLLEYIQRSVCWCATRAGPELEGAAAPLDSAQSAPRSPMGRQSLLPSAHVFPADDTLGSSPLSSAVCKKATLKVPGR